jgi:hypothetical protein
VAQAEARIKLMNTAPSIGVDIGAFTIGELADDVGLVRFSTAQRMKLAKKRQEGRGGWNLKSECSTTFLRELLERHVKKGDMVDIANIAMFIWNRENPYG